MQYNININQKAILEISKKTGVKLGLKHASIIDFYLKFRNSKKAKTKIFEEKEYVWISYSLILGNLPLLEIKSKDVLARYFIDLIKANILIKVVSKEMGNKTYWRPGENFEDLFFDTLPTFQSEPSDDPVDTLPTFQSVNNIHKDHINNKKEKAPSIFFEKIKQITNKLNLEGTPHQNQIISEITERIPKDKIEGYLEYLDQQINEKKEKYLKTAFQPVAFYNWYYKDYLGFLNVELEAQKKKEAKHQQDLEIIDSSKISKEELERQVKLFKDLKIKYKII